MLAIIYTWTKHHTQILLSWTKPPIIWILVNRDTGHMMHKVPNPGHGTSPQHNLQIGKWELSSRGWDLQNCYMLKYIEANLTKEMISICSNNMGKILSFV